MMDEVPKEMNSDVPVIEYRPLGTSGLVTSALGLGCMVLSGTYGRPDLAESEATFDAAMDLGITLLDTADHYSGGENERFIGRLLSGRRDSVVLCSKVGLVAGVDGPAIDARPERVPGCIDASLRRLRTDRLDVWYLHRADPRVPIEETIGAMAEQVTAGKVLHLGLCEVTPDQLRRASSVHRISVLQSEWSLVGRDLEADILPLARSIGVGIVPFSPLGRGFLSGSFSATTELSAADARVRDPRFTPPNLQRNLPLLDPLRRIAQQHGATMGQVALAWLLARGPDVVPIPGVERRDFLLEAVRALDVNLDTDDVETLSAVFRPGAVVGDPSLANLRPRAVHSDR